MSKTLAERLTDILNPELSAPDTITLPEPAIEPAMDFDDRVTPIDILLRRWP